MCVFLSHTPLFSEKRNNTGGRDGGRALRTILRGGGGGQASQLLAQHHLCVFIGELNNFAWEGGRGRQ